MSNRVVIIGAGLSIGVLLSVITAIKVMGCEIVADEGETSSCMMRVEVPPPPPLLALGLEITSVEYKAVISKNIPKPSWVIEKLRTYKADAVDSKDFWDLSATITRPYKFAFLKTQLLFAD